MWVQKVLAALLHDQGQPNKQQWAVHNSRLEWASVRDMSMMFARLEDYRRDPGAIRLHTTAAPTLDLVRVVLA